MINGEDCMPTIKEYQAILHCKVGAGDNQAHFKPYLPEQKVKSRRKLGKILDVEVPMYPGSKEFHGINLDQLIELCNTAVGKKKNNKLRKDLPNDDEDEDDLKMHTFLIAIFGTVVFPGRKDIIDEGIFEFMHKLIKYK